MNIPNPPSISTWRVLPRIFLYGAIVCLAIGIFLPFMTVTSFTDTGEEAPGFEGMIETLFQEVVELFVVNEPMSKSVIGGIVLLWNKGRIAVALLILFVSVVFPIAKLLISILLVERVGGINGQLRWFLERFGPWSLLDATLVALLVISSQGFPLGTVIEPASGFYVFSIGIVLSYFGVLFAPKGVPDENR